MVAMQEAALPLCLLRFIAYSCTPNSLMLSAHPTASVLVAAPGHERPQADICGKLTVALPHSIKMTSWSDQGTLMHLRASLNTTPNVAVLSLLYLSSDHVLMSGKLLPTL